MPDPASAANSRLIVDVAPSPVPESCSADVVEKGSPPSTYCVDEVGLDSMKIMDMVMQIEDHFDVSIPLNVLTDVRTIGDMAGQLQGLMKDD